MSAQPVRAVNRALSVLNVLAQSDESLSLSEIYKMTDLNGPTTYRLLFTLVKGGYVRQDSLTKEYSLGLQSLLLGQSALTHFDLGKMAVDAVRKLAFLSNEMANLALLNGYQAVYILNKTSAARSFQIFTQTGACVPLHCTGIGKAILAFLPSDEVQCILEKEPLRTFTSNTITNLYKISEELELIRRRGYAIDNEERELGVRCIAAPIMRGNGEVFAAVSISGTSARINKEREDELARLVMNTAEEISRSVGYVKPKS